MIYNVYAFLLFFVVVSEYGIRFVGGTPNDHKLPFIEAIIAKSERLVHLSVFTGLSLLDHTEASAAFSDLNSHHHRALARFTPPFPFAAYY